MTRTPLDIREVIVSDYCFWFGDSSIYDAGNSICYPSAENFSDNNYDYCYYFGELVKLATDAVAVADELYEKILLY